MTKHVPVEELDELELWNSEDATELQRPTDLKTYGVTVSSRDWTVETIARQIQQENIDLDPAFQRRNAWRDSRRSRLIESFILGFPVPQLVLAESPRKPGSFIVIDGKQRLMTIAGLFLPEYRDYWTQERFSGLSVLTDLNRTTLDDFLKLQKWATQQRRLANADIRTTVVTGFQHEDVLYDIFYRINTGAVPLSSQELRQVLNRGGFAKYLLEITGEENPLWRVLKIDVPDPRLRDVELLLRLIAWRRFSREYVGNMKPFLDRTMKSLNSGWDSMRKPIEALSKELYAGIDAAIEIYGEDVGRKFANERYQRALNRALFEVQAYHLSFPGVRSAALRKKRTVREQSKTLFADPDFITSIEATTKSIENYKLRFGKYQRMLHKVLGVDVPAMRFSSDK
jgi:hypothetical protein